VPNRHRDVNTALAAYQSATESTRPELEYALIKALEKYARKIIWLKLHESRPEIANAAVHSVLAHLNDFKGESKFSTYVYSVVARRCFEELRRKITNKEMLLSEFKDYQVEALATYELDGDAKITLDRLRKTLSTDENDLIDLKLQGYTHPEIAQRMKATTSTIDGRWRKLCEKLRKQRTPSDCMQTHTD
jgi:RNA polymerase sigma factor (sigma-70 family)